MPFQSVSGADLGFIEWGVQINVSNVSTMKRHWVASVVFGDRRMIESNFG